MDRYHLLPITAHNPAVWFFLQLIPSARQLLICEELVSSHISNGFEEKARAHRNLSTI